MASARLWLRWARRDLRQRWLLVTAIALILAIGIGLFAGLGSTAWWRRLSNDASYEAANMHDLRIELSVGSVAPAGSLRDVVLGIPHAEEVEATAERLITPTQVDASSAGRTILVPGEIVGIDLNGSGPAVDMLDVEVGRPLVASDARGDVAILERKFAQHHRLPSAGRVRVSGDTALEYVGQGVSPEYFLITARAGGFLAQANYAVLFVPLARAQALSNQVGKVNDLVLTLAPGSDPSRVKRDIERALAERLPDVGATVTTRQDDDAYRILYEDIESDQKVWNVLALLVLAGATFAAFNLISRMVESQRRQIGTGMAMGVRPMLLALRPLLFGLQVAIIGVAGGVGVGLLIDAALGSFLRETLPLPVWRTPFQLSLFARAAALGLVLPLVATAWPVWRRRSCPASRRVAGQLAADSGLAPLVRRLRLPGRSLGQMPVRNVLRTPRRTLLTALGIAAAITSLAATVGIIDTFMRVIGEGDRELTRRSPDRLSVALNFFYPLDAPELAAIASSPTVAVADPGLRLVGTVRARGREVGVTPELLHLDGSGLWSPTLVERAADPAHGGIVLAAKTARDLGVRPGETVTLHHPKRTGPLVYRMVDTRMVVAATHPNPLRFTTYLDISQASVFGLAEVRNVMAVQPAPGVTQGEVQRALFGLPGVVSVQPVGAMSRLFKDALARFVGILRVTEGAVLALALLIAFNSTSITVDERAREHATMFAYGVPVRTVLRMSVIESVLTGLLGTAAGIGAGYFVLRWIVEHLMPNTLPEIGMHAFLAPATVGTAMALGVLAVAVTPLLTTRRLQGMDIPSALRVVE